MDVGREQDVKRVAIVAPEGQVAREVLVVGLRLDQFVCADRHNDQFSRNEPAGEPHVDVVRPQQTSTTDAVLDESDRIFRNTPLRVQSRAP